jgi:hypothetical protein
VPEANALAKKLIPGHDPAGSISRSSGAAQR